jgi:hypothetical protein
MTCPPCDATPAAGQAPGESCAVLGDDAHVAQQILVGVPLNDQLVTCTFQVFGWADQQGGKPKAYVRKERDMVVTFVGLDTEEPLLKGNTATGLARRVADDGDTVTLVETTSGNVFSVYMISRRARRAVFTKANSTTIGEQWMYGYASIGVCH